jgi:hypothetical protein
VEATLRAIGRPAGFPPPSFASGVRLTPAAQSCAYYRRRPVDSPENDDKKQNYKTYTKHPNRVPNKISTPKILSQKIANFTTMDQIHKKQ